jgi:hypothetical protein
MEDRDAPPETAVQHRSHPLGGRILLDYCTLRTLERWLLQSEHLAKNIDDFEPGGACENVDSHAQRHIPDIAFCQEKVNLIQ